MKKVAKATPKAMPKKMAGKKSMMMAKKEMMMKPKKGCK